MTSRPKQRRDQKLLGAWYTPPEMVAPLVNWAIDSKTRSLLDPAAGDGAFLVAAARRVLDFSGSLQPASLIGVDISRHAVESTNTAVRGVSHRLGRWECVHGDFFLLPPPGTELMSPQKPVDCVIGNPPFIRYQLFKGESRRRAMDSALAVGVRLSRLSSTWAPFVIHSSRFLHRGGRLALVLPEELLTARYSAAVRDYLKDNFRSIRVTMFKNHVFPDSQVRVVLLTADGFGCGPALSVSIDRQPHPRSDLILSPHARGNRRVRVPAGEWRTPHEQSVRALLDRLPVSLGAQPLENIARPSIGFVSGANRFFVLSQSRARDIGIPRSFLRHCVQSARHAPSLVLNHEDLEALESTDKPVLFWSGAAATHPRVAAYIREGEAQGLHLRYKCRVRSPWYCTPGATTPHAFMTYMSDVGPRVIVNEAAATCSNTLLTLNLRIPRPEEAARWLAWVSQTTLFQLSAELFGRGYGGGLLKLEPGRAGRLLIPALPLSGRKLPSRAEFHRLSELVRSRDAGGALDLADSWLAARAPGYGDWTRQARRGLDALRRARMAPGRLLAASAASDSATIGVPAGASTA